MSKILEALEKAVREESGERKGDEKSGKLGIVALPSITRAISLDPKRLRNAGWVSAMPRPPKSSRTFAALADQLRGQLAPPARILICGAGPKAGVSTTSLNLATELALTGAASALWCEIPGEGADIRSLLGPTCKLGMWDHLARGIPLREVLLDPPIPKLLLLPGRGWLTPSLAPPAVDDIGDFLSSLGDRYPDRYVVVDAPPPLDCRASSVLARSSEATVLVVAAGTPVAVVRDAADALGEGRIRSVLINRALRAVPS